MAIKQPWLHNAKIEFIFILLPSILPLFFLIIFHDYFSEQQEVNSLWWVILILFVDVAHVYSTTFRMYWDRPIFNQHRTLLLVIPVVGLCIGFILHLIDPLLFWRVLAYLAVFHFVRQQYGFMRLYSRKEAFNTWNRKIDTVSIYNATLYPILYWHLNLTDKLNWFVKGDFVALKIPILSEIITWLYWLIVLMTILKEVISYFKTRTINIPKNLILLGTYLSWHLGIVTFQGDLVFTMLNVVAHGIPYMALVWIYGVKTKDERSSFSFNFKGLLIFVGAVLMLAYLEEAIWDAFVWKDHPSVFPLFHHWPVVRNTFVLSLLVPLLTLPQLTHYVLDGFIWRVKKSPLAL